MDAQLSDLQAWFQRQIANVGESQTAWTVEEVIEPTNLRTPTERLSVYQNAYAARLVECLATEFPAVRHAVGEETFLQFAVAHLTRHPPHSYTLGQLGAEFAETLENLRPPRAGTVPDFADFLVELARYERTVSEVFDAEGPERSAGLDAATLPQLTADDLSRCRLEFFPCVRLLELKFPVHEHVTAVRTGRNPDPPAARAVRLVVHRRDYVVRRFEVAAGQFSLLHCLSAGQSLTAALESALQGGPFNHTSNLSSTLFQAFDDWARGGLFRRLILCDAEH